MAQQKGKGKKKVRDWGGVKKEYISNVEESDDSDPDELFHAYIVDLEWDHENEKIILKARDKKTEREWRSELGKKHYLDPSEEYDQISDVYGDDDYELITEYDAVSGDLTVIFKKENSKIEKYKFELPQTKGKD